MIIRAHGLQENSKNWRVKSVISVATEDHGANIVKLLKKADACEQVRGPVAPRPGGAAYRTVTSTAEFY